MRYIPHTRQDIAQMLEAAGVDSVDALFDTIPPALKLGRALALPPALEEEALTRHLAALARRNPGSSDRMALFLGAGAYAHHIPAAVDHMLLRGELFTAYTPYQPEASQGTLQAVFEYQSMLSSLTGCEVVNASMYDGASATAEALLMARRLKKKQKRTLLSRGVHPEVRAVCQTYLSQNDPPPDELAFGPDGRTDPATLDAALSGEVAAVVVQQPNFLGCLEDIPAVAERVHAAGALLVVVVLEPVSLGLLQAPAALGADIVTGEGMAFGSGLNFGGPGLGIFGTAQKNAWQMPGRLVGQTTDHEGRTGYVLTMATREQHIRRARATSNICTNEGLCALAAAVHLGLLGRSGLHQLARTNAANARATLQRLERVPGVERAFSTPFFNEFTLRLARDPQQVLDELARAGIIGGLPLARFEPALQDCLLVCATELSTAEDVERYAAVIEERSHG